MADRWKIDMGQRHVTVGADEDQRRAFGHEHHEAHPIARRKRVGLNDHPVCVFRNRYFEISGRVVNLE